MQSNEKNLYSIADLMSKTAECKSTWKGRLGRRELPFFKLGRSVRVRRTDFECWLESRRVSK